MAVEIGLPFFSDINKQSRNKPYFTTYLSEWICPKDRFPPFQFTVPIDDLSVTEFNLVNVDTGVSTGYTAHFLADTTSENGDIIKWWLYAGDTVLSLTPGRYYFYVKTTDGSERWSEVFCITTLTTAASSTIEGFINIGLPFFDDINKQLSKRVSFNSHLNNWLSASNRFPAFQFNAGTTKGMDVFDLVNSETGITTDFLAYFNANVLGWLRTTEYYYMHMGLTDVVVDSGRYYFHAEGTGGREWWSEEFTMGVACGDKFIEAVSDNLLIGVGDYLLLDATDKLKIG